MEKLTTIIPVYNQEDLIIRAIESIPGGEVIVVNDGSTDNTHLVVGEYILSHPEKNIRLISDIHNYGVGHAVNIGLNNANGEYIVLLGSDDYFLPAFADVIDQLNGKDIVYFDLRINNGDIWQLNQWTKFSNCGSVKCIRRGFIGDTRCPEVRWEEDKDFYQQLMDKKPTEKFTHIVAKHYNFPREGSLCNQKEKSRSFTD